MSPIIFDDMEFGDGVFRDCRKLADKDGFVIFRNRLYGYFGEDVTLTLPENVKRVEPYIFNHSDIREVIIPPNETRIGHKAFESCYSLKKVILSEGVYRIGTRAFSMCINLTDVTLPRSTLYISDDAFVLSKKATLHVPAESYAESYAKKNGLPFVVEERPGTSLSGVGERRKNGISD